LSGKGGFLNYVTTSTCRTSKLLQWLNSQSASSRKEKSRGATLLSPPTTSIERSNGNHINVGVNMNSEAHILTYAEKFVNGLSKGRASMPAMPVHEWMMFMTLVREQIAEQKLPIH